MLPLIHSEYCYDCLGRMNKRGTSQIQDVYSVFSLLLKLYFLMAKVTLHIKQFKMYEFALHVGSAEYDGVIPSGSSG